MEEQLITFETAKLAKEKGYDIECEKYFNEDGELWAYIKWMEDLRDDIPFIPTQSLLQRWLREEHNIDVWAVPFKNIDDEKAYDFTSDCDIYSESEIGYSTYEQALEIGLQEALKLI